MPNVPVAEICWEAIGTKKKKKKKKEKKRRRRASTPNAGFIDYTLLISL